MTRFRDRLTVQARGPGVATTPAQVRRFPVDRDGLGQQCRLLAIVARGLARTRRQARRTAHAWQGTRARVVWRPARPWGG